MINLLIIITVILFIIILNQPEGTKTFNIRKKIHSYIHDKYIYNIKYINYHIETLFIYIDLIISILFLFFILNISIKNILNYTNVNIHKDILSFLGAIIASIVGILGTLITTIINNFLNKLKERREEQKKVCLIMKQLLYAYNRIIGLSKQGREELISTIHNYDELNNLIFLENWSEYLIYINDLDDLQCITMFLYKVENININDINNYEYGIRNYFYGFGKRMIDLDIEKILLKYDKLYLKKQFKKRYKPEYPYQ